MTTQTISSEDGRLLTDLFTSGNMNLVDKIAERVVSLRKKKQVNDSINLEIKLINAVKAHGVGPAHVKKVIKQVESQKKEDERQEIEVVIDGVVTELNQTHAVVAVGKFYVLTEHEDRKFGGTTCYLESKQSFRDMYQNQTVDVGENKRMTKADIWLGSLNRREFKGIEFNPDLEAADPDYYNLWRGFAVKPVQGSCEKYLAFMKEIICGGDVVSYSYLLCWMATLIQHPERVGMVAILLMGGQGIGKGTFIYPLAKLLGGHFVPLSSLGQLLGKFNAHLKHGVLIHGNESLWGGDMKKIGDLKAMITEIDKAIEGKGQNLIIVSNFTHLILSSNDPWPVHLDSDDRRFFVRQVSPERKNNKEYFKEIYKEFENGGLEALLYQLLHTDISKFDVTEIPHNIESFGVKILSIPTTERYIFECLKAGHFDIGREHEYDPPLCEWPTERSKSFIFTDYKCWCSGEGIKHTTSEFLGKALKKLLPTLGEVRRHYRGKRPTMYVFPALGTAREQFEKEFKADSSIWKEDGQGGHSEYSNINIKDNNNEY